MTREEREVRDAAIEKLYMDGKIDREVDAALGLGKGTTACWRYRNECPPNGERGGGVTPSEYVIYHRFSDEVLAMGTARECADILGIKPDSVYHLIYRANHGRGQKYFVVKLDTEEESA